MTANRKSNETYASDFCETSLSLWRRQLEDRSRALTLTLEAGGEIDFKRSSLVEAHRHDVASFRRESSPSSSPFAVRWEFLGLGWGGDPGAVLCSEDTLGERVIEGRSVFSLRGPTAASDPPTPHVMSLSTPVRDRFCSPTLILNAFFFALFPILHFCSSAAFFSADSVELDSG